MAEQRYRFTGNVNHDGHNYVTGDVVTQSEVNLDALNSLIEAGVVETVNTDEVTEAPQEAPATPDPLVTTPADSEPAAPSQPEEAVQEPEPAQEATPEPIVDQPTPEQIQQDIQSVENSPNGSNGVQIS